MRDIKPYQIETGDQVFITLTSGARIAGKAISRMQEDRGMGWHITVKSPSQGRVRVEGADIATIQAPAV